MKKSGNSVNTHFLTLHETQTIPGLQKEFNHYFPFLKIEFYRERSKQVSEGPEIQTIATNEQIGQLQTITHSGKIPFSQRTIVRELERIFSDDFGLQVQVFRKSGRIWLATTSTDDWTLEEQNEEGRRLAHPHKIEQENSEDHDIY